MIIGAIAASATVPPVAEPPVPVVPPPAEPPGPRSGEIPASLGKAVSATVPASTTTVPPVLVAVPPVPPVLVPPVPWSAGRLVSADNGTSLAPSRREPPADPASGVTFPAAPPVAIPLVPPVVGEAPVPPVAATVVPPAVGNPPAPPVVATVVPPDAIPPVGVPPVAASPPGPPLAASGPADPPLPAASETALPPRSPASLRPCQLGVRFTHAANRMVAATPATRTTVNERAKFLLGQNVGTRWEPSILFGGFARPLER
jgi:hypothetical protein